MEDGSAKAPAKTSFFADLREGVSYTVRTPWLLWTLLWACISVLFLIGPIEVLLPFVTRDQLGGDSRMFGFLLAVMGVGSAIAALVTASVRLPRRYLTVMMVCWGAGTLPLAAVGIMDNFWLLALALFIFGATGSVGMVIWGTLLQRRVPPHLLGRVSSLDFFVSLALMPVSWRWPVPPPLYSRSGSSSSWRAGSARSWQWWPCWQPGCAWTKSPIRSTARTRCPPAPGPPPSRATRRPNGTPAAMPHRRAPRH